MEDKIKSIFMGETVRREYECYYSPYNLKAWINEKHIHISWDKICECEIDKPPFEIGETIYINDLNIKVCISDKVRSTNGEIIYYIENYKIVEDEITQKSLEEAESIKESHNKRKVKNSQNKKWFQFWK